MKLPPDYISSYRELKAFVEEQGVIVEESERATRRLYGIADYDKNKIVIYPLAFGDKVEFETLLHEYIHLYLGKGFHHSPLFKMIIRMYGLKPSRFAFRKDGRW